MSDIRRLAASCRSLWSAIAHSESFAQAAATHMTLLALSKWRNPDRRWHELSATVSSTVEPVVAVSSLAGGQSCLVTAGGRVRVQSPGGALDIVLGTASLDRLCCPSSLRSPSAPASRVQAAEFDGAQLFIAESGGTSLWRYDVARLRHSLRLGLRVGPSATVPRGAVVAAPSAEYSLRPRLASAGLRVVAARCGDTHVAVLAESPAGFAVVLFDKLTAAVSACSEEVAFSARGSRVAGFVYAEDGRAFVAATDGRVWMIDCNADEGATGSDTAERHAGGVGVTVAGGSAWDPLGTGARHSRGGALGVDALESLTPPAARSAASWQALAEPRCLPVRLIAYCGESGDAMHALYQRTDLDAGEVGGSSDGVNVGSSGSSESALDSCGTCPDDTHRCRWAPAAFVPVASTVGAHAPRTAAPGSPAGSGARITAVSWAADVQAVRAAVMPFSSPSSHPSTPSSAPSDVSLRSSCAASEVGRSVSVDGSAGGGSSRCHDTDGSPAASSGSARGALVSLSPARFAVEQDSRWLRVCSAAGVSVIDLHRLCPHNSFGPSHASGGSGKQLLLPAKRKRSDMADNGCGSESIPTIGSSTSKTRVAGAGGAMTAAGFSWGAGHSPATSAGSRCSTGADSVRAGFTVASCMSSAAASTSGMGPCQLVHFFGPHVMLRCSAHSAWLFELQQRKATAPIAPAPTSSNAASNAAGSAALSRTGPAKSSPSQRYAPIANLSSLLLGRHPGAAITAVAAESPYSTPHPTFLVALSTGAVVTLC